MGNGCVAHQVLFGDELRRHSAYNVTRCLGFRTRATEHGPSYAHATGRWKGLRPGMRVYDIAAWEDLRGERPQLQSTDERRPVKHRGIARSITYNAPRQLQPQLSADPSGVERVESLKR